MLDDYMKRQVGYLIANAIWTQTTGEKGQGAVIAGRETKDGDYEWEKFFQKMHLSEDPERVKDVADYFLSFYQKMGKKILSDPSFILDNKDPKKNWEQLLSPEALEARAIEETVRQMVKKDPSLKEPLQEYMENQIKEQIAEGNPELEIGYLFAKEPFAPEVRDLKKDSFEVFGDALDELEDHIPAALFDLTKDYDLKNFSTDWKLERERADVAKNFYVGEPEQAEYRLKERVKKELEKQEAEENKALFEEEDLDWVDKKRDDLERVDTERYIPVNDQDLQNYFDDSLGKLKADEYQNDPVRYVERLIKMQMLENQNLIVSPESIKAFEEEKKRIFEIDSDKEPIDALIEKKAELCQKRYDLRREKNVSLGAIDFQIYALEELTKGSAEYKRMEAEKDLSAYPSFEDGLRNYQDERRRNWRDTADAAWELSELTVELKPEKLKEALEEAFKMRGDFMEALGSLDRSEEEKHKKYIEAGELPELIVKGEKVRVEKWKEEELIKEEEERKKEEEKKKREEEEKKKREEEQRKKEEEEKKKREEEQRKREEEERKKREEEQRKREEEERKREEEERKKREEEQRKQEEQERKLQEEQEKKHAHLDRVANDLHASVRKGVFGGKIDNSKKYDTMVQALDSLLKNPIHKEPTPQQKEEIKKAYEVCWNYAESRKGAKTEEGKKRLNLAEEALGILADMNPDLKETYKKAMQGRKKTSFRELEREAGREHGETGEVHREPQREKEAAKERSRER